MKMMSMIKNLFVATNIENYGDPTKYGIFKNIFGSFLTLENILYGLLNLLGRIIYMLVSFILNIVDFIQFFIEKLVGIDFWGKKDFSVEGLSESDIIFRFLQNETIVRVFKYIIGIFAVLLIIFTIIAIVKNEYEYASGTSDKVKDVKGVLKKSLKAIMLVVLVPIILIMGILASNAILASLVNAFNVNNKLSLGGQIFVTSAYDASRYREYANSNERYAVGHKVGVTINGQTKYIDSGLSAFIPKDYKKSQFVGYIFEVNGKYYLYAVDPSEFTLSTGGVANYKFYEEYLTAHLGAKIISPTQNYDTFNSEFSDICTSYMSGTSAVKCNIHDKAEGAMLDAVYNSWYYNEFLTRQGLKFDETLLSAPVEFKSKNGTTFPARYYYNSVSWGALHDGGSEAPKINATTKFVESVNTGFVAIPEEYKVMADIVDYMISDGPTMIMVEMSNPLINWAYVNTQRENVYFNNDYISVNASGQQCPEQFRVTYKDRGDVLYAPNIGKSDEIQGATYIMAYCRELEGGSVSYVPVVHNRPYYDEKTNTEYTFKSSSLEPTYNGLIVARGVLEGSFKSHIGTPTRMSGGIVNYGTGKTVSVDSDAYTSLSMIAKNVYAETTVNNSLTFKNNVDSLPSWVDRDVFNENGNFVNGVGGSYKIAKKSAGEVLEAMMGWNVLNPDFTGTLADSLPISMSFYMNNGTNEKIEVLDSLDWEFVDMAEMVNADGDIDVNCDTIPGDVYYLFATNRSFVNPDGETVYLNAMIKKYTGTTYSDNSLDVIYFYSLNESPVAGSSVIDELIVNYPESPDGTGTNSNKIYYTDYNTQYGMVVSYGVIANNGVESDFIEVTHMEMPTTKLNYNQKLGGVFNYNAGSSFSYSYDGYGVFNYTVPMLDPSIGTAVGGGLNYAEIEYDTVLEYLFVNGGVSGDSNVLFENVADRKETDSSYLFYYYMGGFESLGNLLEVKVDKATNVVSLMALDKYSIYVDGSEKVSETPLSGFEFVRTDTVSGIKQNLYRVKSGSEFYYFYLTLNNETIASGVESSYGKVADDNRFKMYLLNAKSYNSLCYISPTDGKAYLYNTYNGTSTETYGSAYFSNILLNLENTSIVNETYSQGYYTYDIKIYDDAEELFGGEKPIVAVLSYTTNTRLPWLDDLTSEKKHECITLYDSVSAGGKTYDRLPTYSTVDLTARFTNTTVSVVEFKRESIRVAVWKADIRIDLTNIFSKGKVFRFKLGLWDTVAAPETETMAFKVESKGFFLNYNFNSVKNLSMGIFYIPGGLNFIILVIATALVFKVMAQSVWGLVKRIYDIIIYMIIMPAVASTIPLDDSRFTTWKNNLVSAVLGSYGVMIGLNFFFIMMDPIREASQLFRDGDLEAVLAQGNWLSTLSADVVNNFVYLLFLLVALTLIQSMPGLITSLLGKNIKNYYEEGADVKSGVQNAISSAGSFWSGQDLKSSISYPFQQLKNFVPGSAFFGGKGGKDKDKENQVKNARNIADNLMNESESEFNRGDNIDIDIDAVDDSLGIDDVEIPPIGGGGSGGNPNVNDIDNPQQEQEVQNSFIPDTAVEQEDGTFVDVDGTVYDQNGNIVEVESDSDSENENEIDDQTDLENETPDEVEESVVDSSEGNFTFLGGLAGKLAGKVASVKEKATKFMQKLGENGANALEKAGIDIDDYTSEDGKIKVGAILKDSGKFFKAGLSAVKDTFVDMQDEVTGDVRDGLNRADELLEKDDLSQEEKEEVQEITNNSANFLQGYIDSYDSDKKEYDNTQAQIEDDKKKLENIGLTDEQIAKKDEIKAKLAKLGDSEKDQAERVKLEAELKKYDGAKLDQQRKAEIQKEIKGLGKSDADQARKVELEAELEKINANENQRATIKGEIDSLEEKQELWRSRHSITKDEAQEKLNVVRKVQGTLNGFNELEESVEEEAESRKEYNEELRKEKKKQESVAGGTGVSVEEQKEFDDRQVQIEAKKKELSELGDSEEDNAKKVALEKEIADLEKLQAEWQANHPSDNIIDLEGKIRAIIAEEIAKAVQDGDIDQLQETAEKYAQYGANSDLINTSQKRIDSENQKQAEWKKNSDEIKDKLTDKEKEKVVFDEESGIAVTEDERLAKKYGIAYKKDFDESNKIKSDNQEEIAKLTDENDFIREEIGFEGYLSSDEAFERGQLLEESYKQAKAKIEDPDVKLEVGDDVKGIVGEKIVESVENGDTDELFNASLLYAQYADNLEGIIRSQRNSNDLRMKRDQWAENGKQLYAIMNDPSYGMSKEEKELILATTKFDPKGNKIAVTNDARIAEKYGIAYASELEENSNQINNYEQEIEGFKVGNEVIKDQLGIKEDVKIKEARSRSEKLEEAWIDIDLQKDEKKQAKREEIQEKIEEKQAKEDLVVDEELLARLGIIEKRLDELEGKKEEKPDERLEFLNNENAVQDDIIAREEAKIREAIDNKSKIQEQMNSSLIAGLSPVASIAYYDDQISKYDKLQERIDNYDDYLAKHPTGKQADLARKQRKIAIAQQEKIGNRDELERKRDILRTGSNKLASEDAKILASDNKISEANLVKKGITSDIYARRNEIATQKAGENEQLVKQAKSKAEEFEKSVKTVDGKNIDESIEYYNKKLTENGSNSEILARIAALQKANEAPDITEDNKRKNEQEIANLRETKSENDHIKQELEKLNEAKKQLAEYQETIAKLEAEGRSIAAEKAQISKEQAQTKVGELTEKLNENLVDGKDVNDSLDIYDDVLRLIENVEKDLADGVLKQDEADSIIEKLLARAGANSKEEIVEKRDNINNIKGEIEAQSKIIDDADKVIAESEENEQEDDDEIVDRARVADEAGISDESREDRAHNNRILNEIRAFVESSKAFASSSRHAAEASRVYADIASGQTEKYAKMAKQKEPKLSRDERKLKDLEEKRDQRIKDQSEGKVDTKLNKKDQEKAYKEYNKGKSEELQIHTIPALTKEELNKRIIDKYNKEHKTNFGVAYVDLESFQMDHYDDYKKQVEKEYENVFKREKALEFFNRKNGTKLTNDDLDKNKKLAKTVDKSYEAEQKARKAVARNNYINEGIDSEIEKVKQRIALKQAGLYEHPIKKALNKVGGAFIHKMTDEERAKKDDKKSKLVEKIKKDKDELENKRKQVNQEAAKQYTKDKVDENGNVVKDENGNAVQVPVDDIKEAYKIARSRMRSINLGRAFAAANGIPLDANLVQKENQEIKKYEKTISDYKDIKKLEKSISRKESQVLRLNTVVSGTYRGLIPGIARLGKNGGRVKKANVKKLNKKVEKADNKVKKVEDKQSYKYVDKYDGDKEHLLTKKQKEEIESKVLKVDMAEGDLNQYLSSNLGIKPGTKVGSRQEIDDIINEKLQLQINKEPERQIKSKQEIDEIIDKELQRQIKLDAGMDAQKTRATFDLIREEAYRRLQKGDVEQYLNSKLGVKLGTKAKFDSIREEAYRRLQKVEAEKNEYNSLLEKFKFKNHQTYVKKENKLYTKKLDQQTALRRQYVDELNRARRLGTLTDKQEKDLVGKIATKDLAIEKLKTNVPRYKAPSRVKTRFKNIPTVLSSRYNDIKSKAKMYTTMGKVLVKDAADQFAKKHPIMTKVVKTPVNIVKEVIVKPTVTVVKDLVNTGKALVMSSKLAHDERVMHKNMIKEQSVLIKKVKVNKVVRERLIDTVKETKTIREQRRIETNNRVVENVVQAKKIKEQTSAAAQKAEQLQVNKNYIDSVKKILDKSGYVEQSKLVKSVEQASAISKQVVKILADQKADLAKKLKAEVDSRVKNGQNDKQIAEATRSIRAQQQAVTNALNELRKANRRVTISNGNVNIVGGRVQTSNATVSTTGGRVRTSGSNVSTSGGRVSASSTNASQFDFGTQQFRSSIQGMINAQTEFAFKRAYKNAYNDIVRDATKRMKEAGFKEASSSAKAFDQAKLYQEFLTQMKRDLQLGKSGTDTRELERVMRQLEKLEKMNQIANKNIKKFNKSLKDIMNDKRTAKYRKNLHQQGTMGGQIPDEDESPQE